MLRFKSKLLRTWLCTVGTLFALGALPAMSSDAHAVGEQAADFTLRDLTNKQVTLSDYRGKIVLINFWATYCGPCMVEMPHLQKMYAELQDRGFEVLSISIDEARQASMVNAISKRNRLTFPVLLDKDTSVVSQYNPAKVLPYTILLDADGRIHTIHQGYNPGDEAALKEEILALLDASNTPPSNPPSPEPASDAPATDEK